MTPLRILSALVRVPVPPANRFIGTSNPIAWKVATAADSGGARPGAEHATGEEDLKAAVLDVRTPCNTAAADVEYPAAADNGPR